MKIPILTHLQFALLDALGARDKSGRELRGKLKADHGISKTGPAFYQLMARLEEAKFVDGWYEQKEIDGVKVKERCYRLRGEGATALNDAREFYLRSIPKGLATEGGGAS